MEALQPGKKLFRHFDANGKITNAFVKPELDWTAKVVCENCNNRWMSDIENGHAKPALSDLIAGDSGLKVPIDANRAYSMALFCVKTALVIDLISPNAPPFFRATERSDFRTSLAIPPIVNIWMARLAPRGKGRVNSGYGKTCITPTDIFRNYVCTFAAGHFVFQLAAFRSSRRFEPLPGFELSAVPFYPRFEKFVWPPPCDLADTQQFELLAMRWRAISTVYP